MNRVPLAIVGAGPAGLAAAVQAAELGLDVVVIDEAPRPGGQIYRQPPPPFTVRDPGAVGRDYRKGQALIARAQAQRDRIHFRPETLVWGLFPDRELALLRQGRCEELQADALIIAVGAVERVFPFPGWTLPGVTTAGGMQIFLKAQKMRPAERVVVAGTGPLLLVLAEQLHHAGARVAALAELADYRRGLRRLHDWWGNGRLLAEGLGYHLRRIRAGIPFLTRTAVVEARGEGRLEEVVLARLDGRMARIPGSERTLAADALAISHGFVSSTELTLLAGCDHAYFPDKGGWLPHTWDDQETSVPGLFVAGDCAGVAGSAVAEVEGALAAIGAARHLGHISEARARALARPHRATWRRLERFRRFMDTVSQVRPGLLELCTPETVVCRCEEVTRREIEAAVGLGYGEVLSLKLRTRFGMGFCQGRVCRPTVQALVAQKQGLAPGAVGLYHPRTPIRPVTFGELAEDSLA